MRPVLFWLPGDIPVFSYGILLGLSCVLSAHIAVYLGERSKVPAEKTWTLAVVVIVAGVIGARVLDLVMTGKLTFEELFKLQSSGLTVYGGFIAATAVGIVGARMLKMPFWRFADAAAPTMAMSLGITRVGCFLYGCDYGFASEEWGVCFPQGSPAWHDQVQAGLLSDTATQALPVFPTQLLSSAAGLALFGFLMWAWYRRPRREGTVILLFFGCYGLIRAGLELLRADEGRGTLLGLSTSTTIGLSTAAVAALFLWVPALARLRDDVGPIEPPAPAAQEPTPTDASAPTPGAGKKPKSKGKGKQNKRKRK